MVLLQAAVPSQAHLNFAYHRCCFAFSWHHLLKDFSTWRINVPNSLWGGSEYCKKDGSNCVTKPLQLSPTAETQNGNQRSAPAARAGDVNLLHPGVSWTIGSHIAQGLASC